MPVSSIASISPISAHAAAVPQGPGKHTAKGSGTSTRNMPSKLSFCALIGSFCTRQPTGVGSGWLMKKLLRKPKSCLVTPANLCLPKPKITRKTSRRYTHASAGKGAATQPRLGKTRVAGRKIAQKPALRSRQSHG
ncbi:MAG TPA: hypothetical protein VF331_12585 [Polyangiales bacterium]